MSSAKRTCGVVCSVPYMRCNNNNNGQFERDTKDLKTGESWNWLSKDYLKRETESLTTAAQDQALNTNSIKKSIYGLNVSDKCRLCGEKVES